MKGAAAITVGGGGGPVTVLISSITQNGLPVNLQAAAGQLDVNLDVDAGGQALKSVQATLTCGTKTMTRTQTISAAASSASDAAEAQAPVTLSFPTNEFNATTGAATLLNGACTISASATTAGGTQSATNSQSLTLANPDAVIVKTTLNGSSASDVNGLPWKSGDVTVSALPVIYQPGRTVSSVQITLPGATGPTQLVPAAATGSTSATWKNSTSGSVANRVGQMTIFNVGPNGFPVGAHPIVLVIDSNGNDIDLSNSQVNPTAESDFRIDNQSPAQPTTFQVPARQQQWVNAAYTFAGVGGSQGGTTAKYMSGGDAGVGNAPISNGIDAQNTLTWFAAPTASFTGLNGGTGTGSSCSTTGLTQITTANDLAATATNAAYSIRVLETDKLGNVRCQDIGTAVVGGLGTLAQFGVDKVAPTAAFVEPATDANAAGANSAYAAGSVPAVPSFELAISDDASGTGPKPASTTLKQLNTTGTHCLIGSGSSCNAIDTTSTITADGNTGAAGYYTYTATVNDLARNAAPTLTRTVVIDKTAPTMGGIAVPASIAGGTSVSFATSATDNLDLASTNYTLSYGVTPTNGGAPFNIRANGPTLGTPFSGTLTPSSSFSLSVPFFIRNVAVTGPAGAVVSGTGTGLPTQIAVRAIDAAGNVSAPGSATIAPANVPQTGVVNFATQANGATFQSFNVTNAAASISNCPGACTPANATSVSLTAAAVGSESTTFQFANPFTQVQFYYLDQSTNEWTFIGAASAASVTDNGTATARTFTWSLSWDPPATLPVGGVQVIAVGVNAAGDALSSPANGNITLTNP